MSSYLGILIIRMFGKILKLMILFEGQLRPSFFINKLIKN